MASAMGWYVTGLWPLSTRGMGIGGLAISVLRSGYIDHHVRILRLQNKNGKPDTAAPRVAVGASAMGWYVTGLWPLSTRGMAWSGWRSACCVADTTITMLALVAFRIRTESPTQQHRGWQLVLAHCSKREGLKARCIPADNEGGGC
ncbi:MAG TPA: hypothetical protein PL070_21095 [Flavobacteriales bacterium]|nr:hypothetical protein [Flavobacteriales bacterium]